MAQKPLPPTQRFRNITRLGVITTPFGGQTTQEQSHPGVDIANKNGTPLPAFVSGQIIKAENGHVKGENNFGNTVWLRDGSGNIHQYNHLKRGLVRPGQLVEKGEKIAEMGDTGATYSPSGSDSTNLDYRITTAYGKYKNPYLYLRRYM